MSAATTTILVEAASHYSFEIPVETNCVLLFSFRASSELYFAMRFSDVLRDPLQNKGLYLSELELSVCSARDGTFVLDFDNTSSWLSAVQVEISFEVHLPVERGLERPYCFLLTENAASNAIRECNGKHPILYCSRALSTKQIMQSRRRFLAFETRQECTKRMGRPIDFVIDDDFTLERAMGSVDLHTELLPLAPWQRAPKLLVHSLDGEENSRRRDVDLVLSTTNFDQLPQDLTLRGIVPTFLALGLERVHLTLETLPLLNFRAFSDGNASFSLALDASCHGNSPELLRQAVRSATRTIGKNVVLAVLFLEPSGNDGTRALEPMLAEANRLYKDGLFKELGLRAFAAWEVSLIYHLCRYNGWVLPTVYQGEYSCLAREAEDELLPCIRAHGLRFISVLPHELGKYTANYQNVSVLDAALRWLLCHSQLESGDAILVEANSAEHMEEIVRWWRMAKPLPELVLAAIDKA